MPPQILVVEDNPLNMELVTDLLHLGGFQVLQAASGQEGFELAREQQPVLVLMDLGLPDMSGLEVTRNLKGDPRTESIKVVALTAHAMRGDRQKAMDAGCVGYITKPIATRSFVKDIEGYLKDGGEDD